MVGNSPQIIGLLFEDTPGFQLEIGEGGNSIIGDNSIMWDPAVRRRARTTSGLFVLNQWHHVLGVCDGQTAKIFYDGHPVKSSNLNCSASHNNATLRIGKDPYHTSASYWIGKIDDIRIYTRDLSDSEIQELYSSEKP